MVLQQRYTHWPELPEVQVEHLYDGPDTILSSVIFYLGNEVRRYYADGLVGVDNNAISFTLPASSSSPPLVPYLPSERASFARNVANRPAAVLNKEVLPMLDRVQLVNNQFNNQQLPMTLEVVVWNAERGTEWEMIPQSAPNADFLILNEMDWGMARSGNGHTTQQLAAEMQMNYAYGVEFMELTNGNAAEIKTTQGQSNAVGYHGNAILSKYPLEQASAKIVRLHALYDHLYQEKAGAMDEGERRLGGRMALFAVTMLPNGQRILLVSAHTQGGGKKKLLVGDAKRICLEIKAYSNISGVFVGGDMAQLVASTIQSTCGDVILPLTETNNYKPVGNRPVPTWKVVCKDGGPPQARFERGDWLLAGGSSVAKIVPDSVQTKHVSRQLPDGTHHCLSDHSMLLLKVEWRSDPTLTDIERDELKRTSTDQ